MKTKRIILTSFALLIVSLFYAQTGAIEGTIVDSKGDEIPFANIVVETGISNTGVAADMNGHFRLKPLEAGVYNLKISSLGYTPHIITGINVSNDKITFVGEIIMKKDAEIIGGEVTVTASKVNIIDPENTSRVPYSREQLKKLPGRNSAVNMAADLSSEVSVNENNQVIIRGSRPGSTAIFVDGVKVKEGGSRLPSMAVGGVEVYTGGVPAKYGDFTGGVIIMRTVSYFDLLNEYKARESRKNY